MNTRRFFKFLAVINASLIFLSLVGISSKLQRAVNRTPSCRHGISSDSRGVPQSPAMVRKGIPTEANAPYQSSLVIMLGAMFLAMQIAQG